MSTSLAPSAGRPPELPSGTVVFLYTDVEGSTQLWEGSPDAARAAMARHDALIRQLVSSHGGVVFRTQGDGACAAFATAPPVVAAALGIQKALGAEPWPTPAPIRVRMAIHAGAVEVEAGDYVGTCLNRVARLLGIAHGGQALLSEVAAELAGDDLPVGASLQDLGEHRLRDLIRPERVFQLLHPDLPADFPPLRTLDLYPNNLPLQLTSFVGREREIAEVKRLLKASRLVTLTGIGGCGKTRLCLQVSADLLDDYPDGVFLAELAPVSEPDQVARALASALSVREEIRRSAEESLVRHLQGKRLLLILDNCEHLIEACARLADSLLHACPLLQLLATSREALGIPGELPYRVPSLSLPDSHHLPTPDQLSQFESVRLFLDRARSVNSSFHVSTANAPAIAQITWRLDGIPLAIELAAAKTRLLTPEQIAHRLDDQFRLLAGGSRTAVPRQQTLRAAIDWSFSLLSPDEQTLFRRLAVFSGGFSLDAAEVVCSQEPLDPFQLLDLLSSLVDKSLVLVDRPEDSSEARYHLLETIRQYARDRLLEAGEAQATRDRHLSRFLDLAEAAKPQLEGANQGAWLGVLAVELDNLRAALEWSLETSPAHGLRIAASLLRFWQVRGHVAEGFRWLAELVDRVPSRTRARADALIGAGILAEVLGDTAREAELLEESLGIYREVGYKRGIAGALENLGALAAARGDGEAARTKLEEGLAICDEIRDRQARGWVLRALGAVAFAQADYPRAEALYHDSLAAFREVGERWGTGVCLTSLASIAMSDGRYDLSREYLEEGLREYRETGAGYNQGGALTQLGSLSCIARDFRRARDEIEAGRALFAEMDAQDGVGLALACQAFVALAEGARDEATGLLARIVDLLDALTTGDVSIISGARAMAAHLAGQLGDLARATALGRTALSRFAAAHYHPGTSYCLAILGGALVEQERFSDGARTLAVAVSLDPRLGSPIFPDYGDQRIASLSKARAALGEEAFARASAEGQAMTLEEAAEYALSEVPDA